MPALNPQEHLLAMVSHVAGRLANDLKAIPDEQANACPGGCARSAVNIVAECATLNGLVARFLRTGEAPQRPTPEQRAAHLASFDTKEKALAYLEQETNALREALQAVEENTLGEVTEAMFGRPMTRYAVAELTYTHMMYHDGQLNYIHTLHGDDKVHW